MVVVVLVVVLVVVGVVVVDGAVGVVVVVGGGVEAGFGLRRCFDEVEEITDLRVTAAAQAESPRWRMALCLGQIECLCAVRLDLGADAWTVDTSAAVMAKTATRMYVIRRAISPSSTGRGHLWEFSQRCWTRV